MAAATQPSVTLVSSDKEKFVVDRKVAECSVLIKTLLEGLYASRVVSLAKPY